MDAATRNFTVRLRDCAARTEALLDELLSGAILNDEITRPASLMAAIRHGVLNGGKRLRPFLVVETAALLGADGQAALRVGAALECLHSYSLIHDDLPAMDDDDFRRGQPTVHKKFDEATAILAGDSLLTLAFDIIAAPETRLAAERKTALALALARAAGPGGMAGGQMLDLASEKQAPDEAGIVTLQAMKTGALIRFACEAGAILSGSGSGERLRLRHFGEKIGLAYQLADDLLDRTADAAAMGKATLPAFYGEAWTRQRLHELVAEAATLLAPYGERAIILAETAKFVAERQS